MATLYVTEYRGLSSQANESAQAVHGAPLAEQAIPIPGTAAALNVNTRIVRLHTDAICSVRMSSIGGVATTSSARMVAGQTEYFGVVAADVVTVVTNT